MIRARKQHQKKKQTLTAILLAFGLLLSLHGSTGAVGVTHNVYGKLFNADGSVPSNGAVQFTAYISLRPGENISHPGATGSGYQDGWWVVNVGNFPSAWKLGEVLVVKFTNVSNGEQASIEQTLEEHQPREVIVRLKRAD